MKFFAFFLALLCVSYASANVHHAVLDQVAKDLLSDFEKHLGPGPVMIDGESDVALDGQTKEKIMNGLRDALNELIEKIKIHVEKRQKDAKELLEKAKKIVEKIKEAKGEVGQKTKDLVKDLEGQVGNFLKNLIEKIKRAADNEDVEEMELVYDIEDTAMLKNAIKNFIGKVRDAFRAIPQALAKAFAPFRAWLTDLIKKGIVHVKNKHQMFVEIAKEAIAEAKELHKATFRQIIEILRPHHQELGKLWQQLLDAAKKALN